MSQNGIPLAVDCTVVSPLHANGTIWPNADIRAGASFVRAIDSKHLTYAELIDSNVLRLVVVVSEVGGQLNSTGCQLLKVAANHRAVREPLALRSQAARNWESRWLGFLSVATQDALASTLVDDGPRFSSGHGCVEPLSVDVWLDGGGGV